ncbi:MAG: DNA gyrase subunit A [Azospirillum sp. 47_25]|uniref:DNA gyrase subunit A n=1 Tax=Candidatus Scatocola faecipullorum TaxID=2840917 RepID=UPI00095A093E|nr:DNA gyrase subunit A [Azospirillum sp.]OLA80298.1 MAG: DNA gyrase subunit A [Azospirillum sp. 47_25]PWM98064.1 MAG: DNA gyrase subunit A [Azospirillum sp.]
MPVVGSNEDIAPVDISEEMRRSYLDYAMSVIVSRALPDVRDGLKPVHRRIIYSMFENGYDYNRPFRKSARIVGDVLGKYHPHGDSSVYEAMVRMAQPFSMRVPLVDGQGNFGSMDGDSAAAMRYTEARLAKVAHSLIDDIDKDTVDFMPNYDETLQEPTVLPASYPNLLVNGANGIAVGMATNIPPHNLGEVLDACCAYIDNPEISIDDLINIVPGPDFPTGGLILGYGGAKSAYYTGRGSVMMRAKATIEELYKDREAIIVHEIPYQVNKAALITRIAELVKEKKIEGISEIRDESDRQGVRVVIEIKRDFQADVVLNQLYKFTPLQTSFGMNMLAINNGRPMMMNLKDIIQAFVEFREEIIRRRTIFELNKARDRAHVLVGLAIAVENIDPVIELIRNAPNPQEAKDALLRKAWPAGEVETLVKLIDEPDRKVENGTYRLSEAQAKAILDLKLQRLTGLERDKIHEELITIGEEIKECLSILASREKLYGIMRDEFVAIRDEYGTPRRTKIEDIEYDTDIESLIQREEMVVTVTEAGYIKRVPLNAYKAQKRGGKGKSGMATKDEDFVTRLFVASTHTPVLFFSSKGLVYKMKVYKLPLGSPTSKGKPFINLLPLDEGETITTVMKLPECEDDCKDMSIMFATSQGNVRRNSLMDFVNVQSNGKIAMKLDEGDKLINVRICHEDNDIMLAARSGKCIRFPVTDVRVFVGRNSTGVRGIKLAEGDEVISMSILLHSDATSEERDEYARIASAIKRISAERGDDSCVSPEDTGLLNVLTTEKYKEMAEREQFILSVTSTGYGKRTSSYEYRVTGRGGQGIANMEMSARNKEIVSSFPIEDDNQIMMVTDGGKLIRMPVKDIRIAGRKTQGVILFRTAENERVVSVTWLDADDGDDDELEEETGSEVLGDSVAEPEDNFDEVSEPETGADNNDE